LDIGHKVEAFLERLAEVYLWHIIETVLVGVLFGLVLLGFYLLVKLTDWREMTAPSRNAASMPAHAMFSSAPSIWTVLLSITKSAVFANPKGGPSFST
jgi:hypothetical protein